ncbi:uncharacterized protein [Arachis hypogaea]|uniref:uncharacterized protein n=1 Tax=Arachis hypogaea TaxID=3818 RepID=UPI003B2130F1
MVRKNSGKWRMCVDFTDLNKACPKDSYPLPNIDRLVDDTSGYKVLSFMDAYSGYNQIQMHPNDEDKTAFITDQGATYQRLMDKVFKKRNIKIYVDDMVVKSSSETQHESDLNETGHPLRQIPAKPDLAGRLTKWAIELSEFDISYQSRGSPKAQALADFISELTDKDKLTKFWELYVDRASNENIYGAGILLKDGNGVHAEQSIKFLFEATNNQAEYEALVAGLRLAKEAGISTLKVHCDSLLVVQQVEDWQKPYVRYLQNGEIPEDENSRTFRFSLPKEIISDNGRQFTNKKIASYLTDLHIKHRFSSVEHPQINGLAEAANKVILQALKKKLIDAKGGWTELIPEVLWSYNTTPHTTTKESPFRLVYGTNYMIPIEISR